MQFDFRNFENQLKQDIDDLNSSELLINPRYEIDKSYKIHEIKNKMNFLSYTITELQRIYAFLIFPYVNSTIFREYVLMYTNEKIFFARRFIHSVTNKNAIGNKQKDFCYSFLPLFFATSMMEHLIKKGYFSNLCVTENLFGYENYSTFFDKSSFKSKCLAKKRFQKMLFIFYIYFEKHIKENNTNSVILKKWIEKYETLVKNNAFNIYFNLEVRKHRSDEMAKEVQESVYDAISIIEDWEQYR